jgi:hypothetical protein
LSLRYEKEGQPSGLSPIDIFVGTVDPLKEPPLVTANTVLSILAVDYPVDKVSCYVSDDGAAMLTFEALSETSEFARKWVPFCKKFSIEPRAPEWYFQQKIDYLKDKVQPSFVKDRRAMKREYEEFKVRINALVAKAEKEPTRTCNCWPKWCCCCCKSRKKNKKVKAKQEKKKKKSKRSDASLPIFNSEDIEVVEGIDSEKSALISQIKLEKKFGQSPVLVASTLLENGGVPQNASPASLLKEAIHVISCG